MRKKSTQRQSFSCKAPGATKVFVAGTFNNWDPAANPMEKGRDGLWKTTLSIPRGRHEFKFIVDGQWCCDPGCAGNHACPDCVINEHGTMNRVLEIG